MSSLYIILGLFIILFIIISLTGIKKGKPFPSDEKPEKIPDDVKPPVASFYFQIFNRFYYDIKQIISDYSLIVSPAMILSVIAKESALQFQKQKNSEIVGDAGRSIGYMQAGKPAVLDTNSYYKTFFKVDDLYDENKNLIIGSLFLNLTYITALKQNSINPVKLSFKKYNGGNDEKDYTVNPMAEKYSEIAYKYFINFQELIK